MLNLALLAAAVAGGIWYLNKPCCDGCSDGAPCAGKTPETLPPAGTEPQQGQGITIGDGPCDRHADETESQWHARAKALGCFQPAMGTPPQQDETPATLPVAEARGAPNYNTPPIMVPRNPSSYSYS